MDGELQPKDSALRGCEFLAVTTIFKRRRIVARASSPGPGTQPPRLCRYGWGPDQDGLATILRLYQNFTPPSGLQYTRTLPRPPLRYSLGYIQTPGQQCPHPATENANIANITNLIGQPHPSAARRLGAPQIRLRELRRSLLSCG